MRKLFLSLILITLLTGCQERDGEKEVKAKVETEAYVPSVEEIKVMKDSCGDDLGNLVAKMVNDYREGKILELKEDLRSYQSLEKRDNPICVVARSPLNKFISTAVIYKVNEES